MANVAINKSALAQQRQQLRLFQRFLPSLDLKRQQLMTVQKAARHQLQELQQRTSELVEQQAALYEILGAYDLDLENLVSVKSVVIDEENIVGAKLPVVGAVTFQVAQYSFLAKPFWVDFLVEQLQQTCTLQIHLQVQQERVARLNVQVRRITQRVNLFEKVLIPRAQQHIKRIQIGVGELERAAVVRSKIAKKKHATALPQESG